MCIRHNLYRTDHKKICKQRNVNVELFLSVPDRTVYEIESGSYFVLYNSFKQTRTPVVLMYCNEKKKNKNNQWSPKQRSKR